MRYFCCFYKGFELVGYLFSFSRVDQTQPKSEGELAGGCEGTLYSWRFSSVMAARMA